ncbi:hypothetical protein GOC19_06375 [Sinorhizobium meliloti]|nr:hypothetical protein [Sinorhizobium meliloti]MDX0056087.1 hypothetical protein [Sinorhizobium meliloti]
MGGVVGNVGKFLNYGPLGFSALIFVIVVIALLAGRTNEGRNRMLRLIIWVGLFVYCIAAALAFVSEYANGSKKMMTTAQAAELFQAAQQTELAIGKVKGIPGMVSGSCSGGPAGINPDNYSKVVKIANEAATAMVSVYGTLRSSLALAPPATETAN